MQRQERGRKEPSEFNVIVKCKDLIKHTFTITNSTERFPKKYRFTLVNRIQDKAVDIYECALEANELNLKGRCIPPPRSTAGANTGSPMPEHSARRKAKATNSEDIFYDRLREDI